MVASMLQCWRVRGRRATCSDYSPRQDQERRGRPRDMCFYISYQNRSLFEALEMTAAADGRSRCSSRFSSLWKSKAST